MNTNYEFETLQFLKHNQSRYDEVEKAFYETKDKRRKSQLKKIMKGLERNIEFFIEEKIGIELIKKNREKIAVKMALEFIKKIAEPYL